MINTKNLAGRKLIAFMVMIAIVFSGIIVNHKVYAASATVTISSATVTQDEEVKVTVTINADSNIGAYDFYIEYDANILEAVSGYDGGGGGRIQVIYDVPDVNSASKSLTRTITFKAKTPGTSAIKYVTLQDDKGVIDYDTIDNMSVTATDGSVTVNAPVQASSNNNLSSMTVAAVRADGSTYNVELAPGFSKDVTKYNIEVEEGVTRLVVSAKTEDATAKIRTEWAKLDPGDNTTKVIVTAENGQTKQYTIYTKVPVKEETTTEPVVKDPIKVNIGGVEHFIGDINESVALPEGFEPFEYNYEGRTVVAAKGLSKNLIVMYITNGDGSAGSLYIYNETKKTFLRMVNIQMTEKLYTIVDAPEDVAIPENLKECTLNIGEDSVQAWTRDSSEVYVVYAMNWNGEAGLYYYDTAEKQMMKYFDESVESGVNLNEYNNLIAEKESLKAEISKLKANGTDEGKSGLYKAVSLGLGALSLILLGILIVVLAKKSGKASSDYEDNYKDDYLDNYEDNGEDNYENNNGYNGEEDYENNNVSDGEDNKVDALKEIIEEKASEDIAESTPVMPVGELDESDDLADEFEDEWLENEVELSEEQETVLMGFEENIDSALKSADRDFGKTLNHGDTVKIGKALESLEMGNEPDAPVEDVQETLKETDDDYVEYTVDLSFDENEDKKTNEKVVAESDRKDNVDNKKRVESILHDEESSIAKDDIDMVIDELFDDLFGE